MNTTVLASILHRYDDTDTDTENEETKIEETKNEEYETQKIEKQENEEENPENNPIVYRTYIQQPPKSYIHTYWSLYELYRKKRGEIKCRPKCIRIIRMNIICAIVTEDNVCIPVKETPIENVWIDPTLQLVTDTKDNDDDDEIQLQLHWKQESDRYTYHIFRNTLLEQLQKPNSNHQHTYCGSSIQQQIRNLILFEKPNTNTINITTSLIAKLQELMRLLHQWNRQEQLIRFEHITTIVNKNKNMKQSAFYPTPTRRVIQYYTEYEKHSIYAHAHTSTSSSIFTFPIYALVNGKDNRQGYFLCFAKELLYGVIPS